MLTNIRKKLTKVVNESENEGINFNYKNNEKTELYSCQINTNAGEHILRSNENIWNKIHMKTDLCAQKATYVDEIIQQMDQKINKLHTNLRDLLAFSTEIKGIEKSINECTDILVNIGEQFKCVDQKLLIFEDTIEKVDQMQKMSELKDSLAEYKNQKYVEFDKFKKSLQEKHREKLRLYEAQVSNIQRERQAVFQNAFQEDLKTFQEIGTIPKLLNPSNQNCVPLMLEDIILHDQGDEIVFEHFLNE